MRAFPRQWCAAMAFLAAVSLPAIGRAQAGGSSGKAATTAPEPRRIAEGLVTGVARVRPGDRVTIVGDARDFELIEELSLAVSRAGGMPLQVVTREKGVHRYYEEVPAERDRQFGGYLEKLADIEDVLIAIQGEQFPELHRNVSPARLVAVASALSKVEDRRQKRNVRRVILGNGLYPTPATAAMHGMSVEQLARVFWNGVLVDYGRLQANGEAVRGVLAEGREVLVTSPAGTNLRVTIKRRPVLVSDGVISDADIKKKGPATMTWLPAGEVYLAPVPGTAEGAVVIPRMPYEDGVIENLRILFVKGKATEVTAKASPLYDRWKAHYLAAPKGKEELSVIDVGVNPAVRPPRGARLVTFVEAGAVTLGLGGNTWAGGSNRTPFACYGTMNDATVTVDGFTLIDKGELKVPAGAEDTK